ncbi:MAG: alpha-1,4-glucan--maltose-1-phosphate maltosyltransferase [Pseudomonadota bacterium]|nr:alpha-1,4-glucan--maltose-1-phosphate maltosyltransferase [Pseudomonadota bacterium]
MPKKNASDNGRGRIIIEGVKPEIDGGRFAIKRTVGEKVVVECDAFSDSHDVNAVMLQYRREGADQWQEVYMKPLVNDRWRGAFTVTELGRWEYTLSGWVDPFKSWRHDFERRVDDKDIALALQIAADLVDEAGRRAGGDDARTLKGRAKSLRGEEDLKGRRMLALDPDLAALMAKYPDRRLALSYDKILKVIVDEERARYSTWYEFFPRSCGPAGRHGTFKDAEGWLPRIRDMGFDVVYLPPIHPIGRINRKGKNNTLTPTPDDVGVPWAIGADEGGHKAIHPQLGTLEDFRRFVGKANELGIEVALDIAFQAAPDHPWVKEHPAWFRWRPDGTVQYAENPPKKYQDIYPLNFESEDWQGLWDELTSVFLYWCGQGVHIFRVDNPHTKAFRFWDYAIAKVKEQYPNAIFLSEAFTRPKVMHRLAKGGFSQSYTYFTWRNTKGEIMEYMRELTQTEGVEYFRPNFWPNTPDILPQYLQFGGRPAHLIRLVLAATLTASYGLYGPVYEVFENKPLAPGKEEYLNSEKYELRHWELDRPDALGMFIGRINHIRHQNPALHDNRSLRFHHIDNEQIVCYSKATADLSNVILVVVSLDYTHVQAGWVNLDLAALGLDPQHPYQVHDLISDDRYMWHGASNYVELNPHKVAAHIFRVRSNIRTEQDFETYSL